MSIIKLNLKLTMMLSWLNNELFRPFLSKRICYYHLVNIKDQLYNMTNRSTHYAVGHQGSLDKTRQDISGVVLVVRHPGQAGVKRHHNEGELGQRAQQTRSVPRETRLQVKLEETHKVFQSVDAGGYWFCTILFGWM